LKLDARRGHGRAKIGSLGTYVPPKLMTNADLEKLVDTSDQWIWNAPASARGTFWKKAWA
jgi:3-oxoacyl-[acyl-carrier-protein] synthase III